MTRLPTPAAQEPERCDFWTLRSLWVRLSRDRATSPEDADRLARVEAELDRICAPCCSADWRRGQEPFLN